jgi:hypothetical protein
MTPQEKILTGLVVVDERNQDDMSRKAGCYLYTGTRLWLDADLVHRSDGPAAIFPDGLERWYVRGKEVTREVREFFQQNKWPFAAGLDDPEKIEQFAMRFLP